MIPADRPVEPRERARWLTLLLSLALVAEVHADPGGACFDFNQRITEPLRVPLPLVEGRDNSDFGTYPNGVDWAAGRAVLQRPIDSVYAKLLDHQNVKDMERTTLSTKVLERPGYLQFHLVDVVVTLRALFVKMKVAWTEAWGYALVEGKEDAPRKIVISYQKVAGTRYLQWQCGSYVLQARDEASTDLSLYEEVKAPRRSARDTRDMHTGILQNLRRPGP
jgi:hypothetical protein